MPVAFVAASVPSATVVWEASPIVIEESTEDQIDRIAEENGIATTTLFNLAWSESRLDPLEDNGYDRGIVQINRKAWPDITDEMAFDSEFALNWASIAIKEGREDIFVVCSCIKTARAMGAKLPRTVNGGGQDAYDLTPNEVYPRVGGVVLLKYRNSGVYSVAYIKNVTSTGLNVVHGNKKPCLVISEFIPFDSKDIVGYYKYPE